MSDWSSFKDDKDVFDAWRDYIYESNAQDIEIDLDEGFGSALKKAGGAIGKGAKALGRTAAAGAAAQVRRGRVRSDNSRAAGRGAVAHARGVKVLRRRAVAASPCLHRQLRWPYAGQV